MWNSIGGPDDVQPEAYRAELSVGDALLLCSDGLTNYVADEQIEETLLSSETAEVTCRQLVDAANQAGGSDNITVVVAKFQELTDQQQSAADEAICQNRAADSDERADRHMPPPKRPEERQMAPN